MSIQFSKSISFRPKNLGIQKFDPKKREKMRHLGIHHHFYPGKPWPPAPARMAARALRAVVGPTARRPWPKHSRPRSSPKQHLTCFLGSADFLNQLGIIFVNPNSCVFWLFGRGEANHLILKRIQTYMFVAYLLHLFFFHPFVLNTFFRLKLCQL